MTTIKTPDLVHDAELWAAVHRDVQQRMSGIEERPGDGRSQWVVSEGRTSGREFPLFSYRAYRLTGQPDFDPIVVGVTFRCRDGQFSVQGDICREEGGEILTELSSHPILPNRAAVLAAARRAAEDVSTLAQSVLSKLQNHN